MKGGKMATEELGLTLMPERIN